MARGEAHIKTSIWSDEDWRALSVDAQWLYQAVLEQADLSWCGVLTWSAGRFARYAKGMTRSRVERARKELVRAMYLVADDETDEVWVRTFLKWEKVADKPNVLTAATHDLAQVHSPLIRERLVEQFRQAFPHGLVERFEEQQRKRFHEGFPKLFGEPPLDHGPRGLNTPLPPSPDRPTVTPHVGDGEEFQEPPTQPPPPPPKPMPAVVATTIARRQLARQRGRIGNPEGWVATASRRVLKDHGQSIVDLLEQGLSEAQVVAALDPDGNPAPYRPFPKRDLPERDPSTNAAGLATVRQAASLMADER